jgi:hypothetical protein
MSTQLSTRRHSTTVLDFYDAAVRPKSHTAQLDAQQTLDMCLINIA